MLCVDDHALLVQGLKTQFDLDDRIQYIGHLLDASRLLDEVARLKPHVVLLDIEMPGPDAFEVADRLHRLHPHARVVILSAHIRDGYISAACKCSAWGYFAKSDDPEEVVAGVCEVAKCASETFVMGTKVKEHCAPAHIAEIKSPQRGRAKASAGDGAHPATRLESLTAREIEVLRLIGRGMSRTQIATELSRAVKTIDGHQDRIIKKLGVASRADLIRIAIREGFAEA